MNEGRSISGDVPLARKSTGHKVDILIMHLDDEFGCAEAGLSGGETSTKWIKESTLKVPKLLKDMIWHLVKASPSAVENMCLPGFVLSGKTKIIIIQKKNNAEREVNR